MAETLWQSKITDIERGLQALRDEVSEHSREDMRRFGEVSACLERMKASLDTLHIDKAEQVGAARAIAELAAQNSRELSEENAARSRTLTVISLVAGAAYTLVNIAIQKHWF